MLETIKKTILTALKAVPLSAEDIRAIIREFQAEGELTEEQGKKLLDALLAKEGVEGKDAADRLAREFSRLAQLVPVVSRREFRELCERVGRIEERLGQLDRAPEEVPPPREEPGEAGAS